MTQTQTENFNRENVLKALADIVDEYGADYRYTATHGNCRYSDEDGKPSCIVGHVLARVAPEMFARIAAWENDSDIPDNSCIVLQLANNDFELNADSETETSFLINALYAGQSAQDTGSTWGEAEDIIRAVLGEGPRHGEA